MGLTDLIGSKAKSFEIISELVSQSGGISGLIKSFEDHGLSGIVQSWIGTGQNAAINPAQITAALGDERITALANKFGISTEQIQETLTKVLPQIVDKLSPNGQVPDQSQGDKFNLSSLVSLGESILFH